MCIIERFHRIHPDGFREPRQRVRHCQYGTSITPCNATRVVNAVDETFDPVLDAAPAPPHQIIEPRPGDRQRSPVRKKKSKKIVDDIKLVFDFHIPFTSHKKEKKPKKSKNYPRPVERMGRPGFPEYVAVPPELRHSPPQMGYPGPGMHPVPHPPPPHGPQVIQPRGLVTPPITNYSFSSTDSSPSPLSPTREHHRRARSLSLTRQYEERKQMQREQERREHAERVALAENAARLRAERDAERIREERDRERRRNDDLRAREQRRQIEAVERERRRRSQEERERLAHAIVTRRRREEHDRRRAAEALLEQERREIARRRREEEEREWRLQEERDRLRRQRVARIPRAPRHAAAIHHHHHHHHPERDGFEQEARDNFEHRGDEVINEAIRTEQRRQAEQDRNGAQPEWPAGGGPRRRRTIAAGERRAFDDDRRRWGNLGGRWF